MPVILGFAGYSDSGKTTLISRLVPLLRAEGYRVAVMKHDAHGHYKEAPGTDSALFAEAGADAVWTLSPEAVHTFRRAAEPQPEQLIERELQDMDIVLIEGFKRGSHPKIAVFRNAEQSRILEHLDPQPFAIAAGIPHASANVPVFALDDADGLAGLLLERIKAWQDKV